MGPLRKAARKSISNRRLGPRSICSDSLAHDANDILCRPNVDECSVQEAHSNDVSRICRFARFSVGSSDRYRTGTGKGKERSTLNVSKIHCRALICNRDAACCEKCDKVINSLWLIWPVATSLIGPPCHFQAEVLQNPLHPLPVIYRDDFVVLVVCQKDWCADGCSAFDFIMKWQPRAEAHIPVDLQTTPKQTMYGDCSPLTDSAQEDVIKRHEFCLGSDQIYNPGYCLLYTCSAHFFFVMRLPVLHMSNHCDNSMSNRSGLRRPEFGNTHLKLG
ncbi:hypothetical protein KCU61_g7, partial [Aureobasidium melanogenum]